MKNISLTTFLKKRMKENGAASKNVSQQETHTINNGSKPYRNLHVSGNNYSFELLNGARVRTDCHPDTLNPSAWEDIYEKTNDYGTE